MTLKIGTRGSQLATTQAGLILDQLVYFGREAELKIITTDGDTTMAPVEEIGVGVFTQALREALAKGECDVAVHSFKDLPTADDDRFFLSVPRRSSVREALVSRDNLSFDKLPENATVGTSAPRRIAQLRGLRPDLNVVPLRGNIDTRLAKVDAGELDAIVIANAGLLRLGLGHRAVEVFDPERFIPAPAQGALAVECRADDKDTINALQMLSDADTYAMAIAERTVLNRLEAGCTAPVGAYSNLGGLSGDTLNLTAGVFALDGSTSVVYTEEGPGNNSVEMGEIVADQLLQAGAADILS